MSQRTEFKVDRDFSTGAFFATRFTEMTASLSKKLTLQIHTEKGLAFSGRLYHTKTMQNHTLTQPMANL